MSSDQSLDVQTLAMLRESMGRYRQSQYQFERRGRWLERDSGYSVDAWRSYAEFGWLALPLAATHGGFGDDLRAVAALMEYVGGALALEPILASAVLSGRLLARLSDARAVEALEAIASGRQIFAFAHDEPAETWYRAGRLTGAKTVVLHGDVADQLIVSARNADGPGLALCLVDPHASGVAIKRNRLVDGRGAASIEFRDAQAVALDPGRDAASVVAAGLDDARLAMCSETYGAVCTLNEATNAHLKTRHQFGRPIGANQALQHRMVELYMLQEELRAVIDAAHRAQVAPATVRIRAISAAAAHAATVARHTAHEAVQLHGGMGITQGLPVSHYFKRLMVTARLLGDREAHLERFAGVDSSRALL